MKSPHKTSQMHSELFKRNPQSLTPVPASKKSVNSYISMQTVTQNSSFILRRNTNNDIHPNLSRISSPIDPTTELKPSVVAKLRKADQQRIDELEVQVNSLTTQLTSVKEMNKVLLGSQDFNGGEIHSLYQDLFITDLKQQMNDLNGDISKIRAQKQKIKQELKVVKKENTQLQAIVKRYRSMLADVLKVNKKCAAESVADSSSMFSGFFSESDKAVKQQEITKSRLSINENSPSIRGLKLSTISLSKIEKLNLVLLQLNHCNTFNQLCKILTRSAKGLTKSQKVTIFMISNKAKDFYIKSYQESSEFIGKARLGNSWIFMHTHKDAHQSEPLFKKLDDLKYPIRLVDLLVVPITYDREISMVIQCQDKAGAAEKSRIYTPYDELMIKSIANVACIKIESIYSAEQESIELNHSIKIAEVIKTLLTAQSHKEIANRVRSVLPEFFGFENAGVAFFDSKSSQFYVMTHDPSAESFFGDSVLKFPRGTGLTSQLLNKGVTIFHNPKMMPIYNPELDNVGWIQETKAIMMGCLKDWNDNIVGVIQLTNKKNGDINAKDKKKLENVLGLLGATISSANLSIENFSLIIKFKDIMEKIVKLVADSNRDSIDADFTIVSNQISVIKSTISEWIKNRKVKV